MKVPRVFIETDDGERVGEVPVYEVPPTRARYGHGWDGAEFERHWSEAKRREEKAAQRREAEEAG